MRGPSEGVRVEASILARLLGIKLLKLDATVLVLPADAREVSGAPNLIVRTDPARRGWQTAPSAPAEDRRLADAVRNLDEGARLLEEARRNSVKRPSSL
jgi:hypothetical protein